MNKTTISTLIGAAVVTTLGAPVHAQENPFALKELASGYVQVAEAGADGKEMKCGSGKCGGAKTNEGGMNCGAMMQQNQPSAQDSKKAMEGKCAGMNMGGQAPAAPAAPAQSK
jgi:uncharacterized low-complexity protein